MRIVDRVKSDRSNVTFPIHPSSAMKYDMNIKTPELHHKIARDKTRFLRVTYDFLWNVVSINGLLGWCGLNWLGIGKHRALHGDGSRGGRGGWGRWASVLSRGSKKIEEIMSRRIAKPLCQQLHARCFPALTLKNHSDY